MSEACDMTEEDFEIWIGTPERAGSMLAMLRGDNRDFLSMVFRMMMKHAA